MLLEFGSQLLLEIFLSLGRNLFCKIRFIYVTTFESVRFYFFFILLFVPSWFLMRDFFGLFRKLRLRLCQSWYFYRKIRKNISYFVILVITKKKTWSTLLVQFFFSYQFSHLFCLALANKHSLTQSTNTRHRH